MRYWDYTGKPFNLNGYICLFCSVGWGLFSVALVGFAHCVVERFVLKLPEYIIDPLTLIITIVAVIDFTQSFNAAMDLREIMEKISEANNKLKLLEKRADVVAAVVDDEIKHLRDKSTQKLRDLEEFVKNPKHSELLPDRRSLKRLVRIIRRNPYVQSREFAVTLSKLKNIILRKK